MIRIYNEKLYYTIDIDIIVILIKILYIQCIQKQIIITENNQNYYNILNLTFFENK